MIVAKIEKGNYSLFPDEEAVIARQPHERLRKLGIPAERLRRLGIPVPDEETPTESFSTSQGGGRWVATPTSVSLGQEQQERVASLMEGILSFVERIKGYLTEQGIEMWGPYMNVGLARVWNEFKEWDDPLHELGRVYAFEIASRGMTPEAVKQALVNQVIEEAHQFDA